MAVGVNVRVTSTVLVGGSVALWVGFKVAVGDAVSEAMDCVSVSVT